MGIWYTTLETVKGAVDVAETARNNAQIRRCIESGSRSIDGARVGQGQLGRRFYPETLTRYFDAPTSRPAWQLPLGEYELISVTSITSGGVTITPGDYILQPENDGPPYDRIDLNQAVYSSWPHATAQRAIGIAGQWNFRADEELVGALTSQLGAAAGDVAAVAWNTARIGTGNILRIDDERVVIRERTWSDSGQNLGAPGLTASMAGIVVPVTTGSAYAADEVLLVDGEKMRVVDVAGNNLIVIRAWDGSVLAAHDAGADVYTLTGVQLDRGQLGTTAAVHDSAAAIYRHIIPGLVDDLCLAESLNQLQQELGAYGRSAGSGESASVVNTVGLERIRADAFNAYGRITWLGV